jgi:P22 coat protein - gene protein 5
VANTFVTPSVIAARGIATLYNVTVLAGLVWRDFDSDFSGKQGDTVTVRKPAVFDAEEFDQEARTTTWQDAVEDSVPITLDKLPHVPFHVTDEQSTLEINDFQEQLLTPAAEALAQKVDGDVAEALVDAAAGPGGGGLVAIGDDPNPDGPEANFVFRKAREFLTRNKLPLTERYAVLSPEGATEVFGDKLIIAVDKSGASDALRNAIMGNLLRLETYESQVFGVGAGDRGQADGVAFHRSALVLAARPLQQPRGLPSDQVSVQSYKQLSLRTVYSYDHDAKMDKVTLDILYGLKATRPQGAVELDFGQGS